MKEEHKQETIEEAAERILANNIDGLKDALQDDDLFYFYKGVVKCYGESMAKWQQERMYSEDAMRKVIDETIKACNIAQKESYGNLEIDTDLLINSLNKQD